MEVVNAVEGADGFLWGKRRRLHDEGGLLLEGVSEDAQLALVGIGRNNLLQEIDAGGDIRVVAHHRVQLGQGRSLQDGRDGAVGHLQRLDELTYGAVSAEVFLHGIFHGDVHLGNGYQPAVAVLYIRYQFDGFLAAHRDGEDGSGEHDSVAEGEYRQHRGKLRGVHFHGGGFTDNRHYIYFYARRGGKFGILLHNY